MLAWKSPIEITEEVTAKVVEQKENAVYQAVIDAKIKVDKAELIKALSYDRAQYETGEWDMFCLITSAWFGKQMYSLNESNERVYSRYSCKHMTKDEAFTEFLDLAVGE